MASPDHRNDWNQAAVQDLGADCLSQRRDLGFRVLSQPMSHELSLELVAFPARAGARCSDFSGGFR